MAVTERRTQVRDERNRVRVKKEGLPAAAASGPVIKPLAPPPPRPNLIKKEKDKKKEDAKTAAVQETFEFIKAEGDFHTPPFSLLDVPPATEKTLDRDALTMNARLLEKNLLKAADPAKGKFRSFLLGSLQNFLNNEFFAIK